MGNENIPPHWEKLVRLIDAAKVPNSEVGEILKTGSPNEVTVALQEWDITMDDLGEIFTDLEYIADRNSLRFWSPLA